MLLVHRMLQPQHDAQHASATVVDHHACMTQARPITVCNLSLHSPMATAGSRCPACDGTCPCSLGVTQRVRLCLCMYIVQPACMDQAVPLTACFTTCSAVPNSQAAFYNFITRDYLVSVAALVALLHAAVRSMISPVLMQALDMASRIFSLVGCEGGVLHW